MERRGELDDGHVKGKWMVGFMEATWRIGLCMHGMDDMGWYRWMSYSRGCSGVRWMDMGTKQWA